MSEPTPAQRVIASDLDQDVKTVLLRALADSECPDCAAEAQRVLGVSICPR